LVDLATELDRPGLERAIAQADSTGLIRESALRVGIETVGRRPGVKRLRTVLDRRTFRLTRSELERLFLPLAAAVGLPVPETRAIVDGYEVDFHWAALNLVVETDGLTYHRTTGQQAKDRLRDQTHTAAGLTHLRFTHEQVSFEPGHVKDILRAVACRLGAV
jgi:very-short-patch-repair endonuclease